MYVEEGTLRESREDQYSWHNRLAVFRQRFVKFSRDSFNPRMIGFALCRAWVYVTFFNTAMLIGAANKQGALSLFYQISLMALIASLIASGLADTWLDKAFKKVIGRIFPAAMSVIGTAFMVFSNTETTTGLICVTVAGIFTGIGSGIILVYWGKIYSSQGGPISAAEASIAFVIGTLLIPIFCLVPLWLQLLLISLLPVASTILLVGEFKKMTIAQELDDSCNRFVDATPNGNGDDSDATLVKTHHHQEQRRRESHVLLKVSAGSLVFGCVIDVIRSVYVMHSPFIGAFVSNLVLPISSLIAGTIILFILLLSRRLDFAFTYRPVLIFMSLSCLALPLCGDNFFLTYVLAMSGYFCFEIMNWVMLSDITYRYETSAYRVYGFGRAAVAGGVLLGQFAGTALASLTPLPSEVMYAISLVLIFMMIVTYTLTLTERDVAKITRMEARPFKMPKQALESTGAGAAGAAGAGAAAADKADAGSTCGAGAAAGAGAACEQCPAHLQAIANSEANTTQEKDAQNAATHEAAKTAAETTSQSAYPTQYTTLEHELSLTERVEILADEYDITGRAFDVLLLFAKGRSAARVEQELYISRGTVNTYSHRIYQKLGIHSRQELFDMVDNVGTTQAD